MRGQSHHRSRHRKSIVQRDVRRRSDRFDQLCSDGLRRRRFNPSRRCWIEVTADPDSVPRSVRARQLFTDAQAKRHDGQAEEAATRSLTKPLNGLAIAEPWWNWVKSYGSGDGGN